MLRLLNGARVTGRRVPTGALRRDARGAVGMMFALSLTMFVLIIGAAVDFTRAYDLRTEVQNAVDDAVLSAAAVYTDSTQASVAQSWVFNYFASTTAGYLAKSGYTSGYSQLSYVASAAPGVMSNGQSAYEVTLTVVFQLPNTFMAFLLPDLTLTATATAANPIVTPTFSAGHFSSSAADMNTVYAYAVPMSGGKPQYSQIPTAAQLYAIANNNPNQQTAPNGSFPAISATQPIAFALQNVTGGLSTSGRNSYNCNNPMTNAYNVITGPGNNSGVSGTGQSNWFYTGFLALGQSPATATNYSYTYTGSVQNCSWYGCSCSGPTTIHASTSYPTNTNCSIEMAPTTPTTSYLSPPSNGSCFTPSATPGLQYATMSCQQYGGNTYSVWWNDMGGYGSDDKDYNDAYFTVTCSTATPSGKAAITQVVLIK